MKRSPLTFHNSIRIDGGLYTARDQRIVWGCFLPNWAILVYCTVAEWFDPSDDTKGGAR